MQLAKKLLSVLSLSKVPAGLFLNLSSTIIGLFCGEALPGEDLPNELLVATNTASLMQHSFLALARLRCRQDETV